ncbi:hypothetical protein CVT25_006238 [Psilocybe cyanescens]|uniref:Uncharacterized protein n=1 Tax=Psilocybe cyanescens TaxID=93625 RepID=A0A409XKM5_PSICY|nr:hypothetical protein CVT25_006238 [Psilocybe cyanescens]
MQLEVKWNKYNVTPYCHRPHTRGRIEPLPPEGAPTISRAPRRARAPESPEASQLEIVLKTLEAKIHSKLKSTSVKADRFYAD